MGLEYGSMVPSRGDSLDKISLLNAQLFQGARQEAEREVSKTLFIISTGTLVLSVSFINFLWDDLVRPGWLFTAWIFLAASVACHLRVQNLTWKIEGRKLEHVNNSRKENHQPHWDTRIETDTELRGWSNQAHAMRSNTFFLMAVGLAALLWFAALNVMHKQDLQSLQEKYEQSQ